MKRNIEQQDTEQTNKQQKTEESSEDSSEQEISHSESAYSPSESSSGDSSENDIDNPTCEIIKDPEFTAKLVELVPKDIKDMTKEYFEEKISPLISERYTYSRYKGLVIATNGPKPRILTIDAMIKELDFSFPMIQNVDAASLWASLV